MSNAHLKAIRRDDEKRARKLADWMARPANLKPNPRFDALRAQEGQETTFPEPWEPGADELRPLGVEPESIFCDEIAEWKTTQGELMRALQNDIIDELQALPKPSLFDLLQKDMLARSPLAGMFAPLPPVPDQFFFKYMNREKPQFMGFDLAESENFAPSQLVVISKCSMEFKPIEINPEVLELMENKEKLRKTIWRMLG